MAATSRAELETRHQHSSSPSQLSSPPSGSLSEPGSPSRHGPGRANIAMGDEIIVDTAAAAAAAALQAPSDVPLTAAGIPRKKPGRKPGSTVKPKNLDGTDAPKPRRQRKLRDPSAPPIQRKRKVAPADDDPARQPDSKMASSAPPTRQTKITELTSMRMDLDSRPSTSTTAAAAAAAANATQHTYAQQGPKRELFPGSMQGILNADPPTAAPARTSGQSYDPIRASTYDPVRESFASRDPYGTGPLGSPCAPSQIPNRASASPSIASIVDPAPAPVKSMISPSQSHQSLHASNNNHPAPSRLQESPSMPPSPTNVARSVPSASAAPKASKPETEKYVPPSTAASKLAELIKPSNITTISNGSVAITKKVTSMVQQERKQKNGSTASSSPKVDSYKDGLPDLPGSDPDRSILDFGKGQETSAPSIVLHIPLNGETNKYVNFMRMAEQRYGWDALHPRLAAHRDRKARIAAASAALEKAGSGRESGDEMSDDVGSNDEGSDKDMGGIAKDGGGTSGPDGAAPVKPKKKRNFKEDEYDKDDDFVDDSELLWEEQAAASRDGFFVYSGPLVPEVEKPAAGTEPPPKRGRGSRGGRGGARGAASGRGSRGGPGSRGGIVRKPRITKSEKAQLDREKAEREKLAQLTSKSGGGSHLLQPGINPPFSTSMVVDG